MKDKIFERQNIQKTKYPKDKIFERQNIRKTKYSKNKISGRQKKKKFPQTKKREKFFSENMSVDILEIISCRGFPLRLIYRNILEKKIYFIQELATRCLLFIRMARTGQLV